MRLVDLQLSFPSILMALLIVSMVAAVMAAGIPAAAAASGTIPEYLFAIIICGLLYDFI